MKIDLVIPEEIKENQEEVLKLVDAEIEKFSKFMSSIGDWKAVGPLNAMERMLLRTYLVQKIRGRVDAIE